MNKNNALLPDIQLRFNIEHPSFEECYAFGYECGSAEISEEDNPFNVDSKESDQWLEGWWAGFYGEEPLYDLSQYIDIQAEQALYEAANDQIYQDKRFIFLTKVLEISGVIAVSAFIGYQMIEMVA